MTIMKQRKILFVLAFLCLQAWQGVYAHDIEVANADGVTIYYVWTNNQTELAVSYRGSRYDSYSNEYSGAVNIPESVTYNGKTYPVTSIGRGAFYTCIGLTSITIPRSVTSIDEGAFNGCSGLTSVTIPNSVTNIGDAAFYNCNGLTSVTIGNGVTSIGGSAFRGCSGLTSVIIPNSVTSIGGSAFEGCSGLTSVIIPNSVTSIGSYAFAFCSGLTSVTIPNSVTSIGGRAFRGCSGLTSVTIPGSVTSIGNGAFEGCSGLTSVTIPGSVTSIGSFAFYGCSGLTSVTIPGSVTSIGEWAFADCSGLTSVTCYATTPPSLGRNGFSDYSIPLYVPKGSVIKYKAVENWRNFVIIREISEEQDVYLSIRQANGSVNLKVDAEKPYFNLQIKADDGWKIHSVTLGEDDVTAEVASDGSYTTPVISSNSVLNVTFEKGTSGVVNQMESRLHVTAHGNTISVQGAENGEQIAVYSVDGKLVETAKAMHGSATITLPENETYIVKGRQKTVKVRL